MASPYFESANAQVDASKKGLLDAVAQAGTAGKAAYDQAQAQAAQARQEALDRAAQRSALYGVGGDSQTYLGAYDARANQMAVNRSNFESGLAQTQASGNSYLEKARSAIPMLEAQNIGKITDQETKIKVAIQAAKDKAAAEAQKQAEAEQRQIDRENRANSEYDRRQSAKEAAKAPKAPTSNQLLGAGQAIKDQLLGAAGKQVDYAKANLPKSGQRVLPGDVRMTDNLNYGNEALGQANRLDVGDLARQIARNAGMDEATINSILTPSSVKNWDKVPAPVKDTTAKALATKYDTRGVTYDTALSAINGQDYQTFVDWLSKGADGATQDEAADKIRRFFLNGEGRKGGNPGPWNAEYQILMGEYVPKLPKK